MSAPVYDSKTIDIALKSSEKTVTTVTLTNIPVSANVTATITDDTSPNKCFKVEGLKKLELEDRVIECDPDLPPAELKRCREDRARGHLWREKDYVVTDATNGSTPLNVNTVGQPHVEVDISFEAPDPPQWGIYKATLLIQGDTWDPIKIPLSLFSARIDTLVSYNDSIQNVFRTFEKINISVPITTKLIAGPDADVIYDPNDIYVVGEAGNNIGVYMEKSIVSVTHTKPEVPSTLKFTIDKNAVIGRHELIIPYKANALPEKYIGEIRIDFNIGVRNEISIEIALGKDPIFVLQHAYPITISLNINLDGEDTFVVFSPNYMPEGVSMSRQTFSLTQGSTNVKLRLNVDPHAPINPIPKPILSPDNTLEIYWSAYDGQRVGMIKGKYLIIPVRKVWKANLPWSAGNVEVHKAVLTAWSSGEYRFYGDLYDNSNIYGDDYTITFICDYKDENGKGFSDYVHGGIRDSSKAVFDSGARYSDWLKKNWQAAYNQNVKFNLEVHGDLGEFPSGTYIEGLGEVKEDTANVCIEDPKFGTMCSHLYSKEFGAESTLFVE